MALKGIEQNPKLGYYQVGDQRFYSKPEAYIYATKTNQIPSWNFNNVEFAKFNWTIDPDISLSELYRMRAQQLRDRYDYIRLECSGGADSTTVAFSFLLNNIHLDEIIFRYPKAGEKGAVDNNPYNTTPNNTLGEWQFAAKPLFDWIKTNYPNTLIRIHDYSEDMIAQENTRDESWIFATRDWFQPGHADKYSHVALKEHRDLLDSGKSLCVLIGIDKPKLFIIEDNWYMCFTDVQANSANPVVGDYTNITSEYFYWTPDFPELVAKQSHIVKDWFDMPENQSLKHLVQYPISLSNRTAYETMIKALIYPDYDHQTWQTSKPTNSFYNEMDYWFYKNFKDTKLYSTWEDGLQFLIDKIDSKYLIFKSGRPTGLQFNYSLFYHLGSAIAVTNQPAVTTYKTYSANNRKFTAIKDQKIKTHIL